jgi:hypothetical protein
VREHVEPPLATGRLLLGGVACGGLESPKVVSSSGGFARGAERESLEAVRVAGVGDAEGGDGSPQERCSQGRPESSSCQVAVVSQSCPSRSLPVLVKALQLPLTPRPAGVSRCTSVSVISPQLTRVAARQAGPPEPHGGPVRVRLQGRRHRGSWRLRGTLPCRLAGCRT